MDAPLDKVLVNTPPPPPMEVKIRTMRSDIESMRKSGGGAPSFRDVTVRGLSMEKEYHPAAVSQTPMPSGAPEQMQNPKKATTEAPAVSNNVPPMPRAPAAPEPAVPQAGPPAGSESHLVPILIVALVAFLAIAAVGYFAYILFIK